MEPSLAGVGVLITRPVGPAASLAARIAALGGTPVLFPAIEIADLEDRTALDARLADLPDFDLIVFVSPSAVECALPLFESRQPGWAEHRRLAAVGRGSLHALQRHCIEKVMVPPAEAGAAGLLRLPELLQPVPRRVLIVRGVGGRDEFAQSLGALGAQVEYAECYRRIRPAADPEPLLARWRLGEIGAVTVTSLEILDNLQAMLGPAGAEPLHCTPMFVHHPRIAGAARRLGVETVIESTSDEDGLVASLVEYFAEHG